MKDCIFPYFHISKYVEIVSTRNILTILFKYGLWRQYLTIHSLLLATVTSNVAQGRGLKLVN